MYNRDRENILGTEKTQWVDNPERSVGGAVAGSHCCLSNLDAFLPLHNGSWTNLVLLILLGYKHTARNRSRNGWTFASRPADELLSPNLSKNLHNFSSKIVRSACRGDKRCLIRD